eukprot:1458202-Rhodomonas_salina.4
MEPDQPVHVRDAVPGSTIQHVSACDLTANGQGEGVAATMRLFAPATYPPTSACSPLKITLC